MRQRAGAEYLIDQIKYPPVQCAQFIEVQGKGQLSARAAETHVAFVRSEVAALRKAPREIDEEIAALLEICSN